MEFKHFKRLLREQMASLEIILLEIIYQNLQNNDDVDVDELVAKGWKRN